MTLDHPGGCLAAQLAVGGDARVTDQAAAAMWGMGASWAGEVVLVSERRVRPRALTAVLGRAPGSRGVGVLRELLGLGLTRSALERRFRRFVRRLELPLPLSGVLLEGYECDCYWPEHGLVVELDSWRFHRGRGAFERNRDRDLDLAAVGIRVLRLTYRQLTRRTPAMARVLRAALAEG